VLTTYGRYMAIVREDSAARSPGVRLAMAAVAAVVIVVDQVSKTLVLASHPAAGAGWVTIRLVRNTGANGGIGAGYPVAVTLAAVLIAGVAGAFAVRVRGRATALFLAAVLGGALGNLSDRVFRSPGFGRGPVVDWIHLGVSNGSFNVADMAIQVGVLGAVIAMFASERPRKARQPRENVNPG
jgi:signal peptidase II